jgi:putative peptide zinc metalloprotease protein
MTTDLPKLRSDLIFSPQQTVEGTHFVVKDPLTGEFFRFREAEQFITKQCDGKTPLEVVRQRAEKQFGAPLTEETLSAFIRNLGKRGLLETENGSRKGADRRGQIRGNLLYFRFKLFDPNRLLGQLVSRLKFLYTPQFLICSAALIVLALGITITNQAEFSDHLAQLYRVSTIPLLVVTIILVVAAHEFAHGLTCRYFGGEVHEIGFMLIYFQPAFYCNVSDAWLFPEKSKRLWVAFAGPYFELFIWALATLLWRLTDVETWLNHVAFMVVASSGIKTLMNFNPLIKLDGYYLLSDYLEIPNLRRKSFSYIGTLLKQLGGSVVEGVEPPTPRERKIYLAYGLVATVCSFSLLAVVAVKAGGFLIEQQQPAGFALFAVLLGLKLRQRLRRLKGKSAQRANPSADPDDAEAEAEAAAVSAAPAGAKAANGILWWGRYKWRVLAAIAAVLMLGRTDLRIGGQFNILPSQNADVRAEIEGIIENISIDEGDQVHAGDPIARISGQEMKAELAKTEALLRQTRAKFKMLEIGPAQEEIEVAKAAVTKAEDTVKYARIRRDRDQKLFEEKLVSQKDLEVAQEMAATAENGVAEARGKLKVLLRGSRPEELDATKAEIEGYEAQRSYLEGQIRLLNICSPASGIVATPSRQLKDLKRQLVKKGDLIARIYDVRRMAVEIIISEKEIADVKPGQRVVLRVRAYPDLAFEGTVKAVAATARGESGSSGQASASVTSFSSSGGTGKMVLVTTEIDNKSFLLKPEMTGQAKIICGKRWFLGLLTRRLTRMVKVEFWSWW